MNKLDKAREDFRKAYYEKLKDPRWQKRRLEIMSRDEFTCQSCYDTEATLNVHHTVYRNGADPWDYPDNHLLTLCESCHEDEKEMWDDKRFGWYYKNAGLLFAEADVIAEAVAELTRSVMSLHTRDYAACAIAHVVRNLDPVQVLEFYAKHVKRAAREREKSGAAK